MIYEYYKINEDAGATYELQDLFAVQLKGDKLEAYLQTWDATLTGMKQEPDLNVLETLFLQQMRRCHSMKDDIIYYDRLDRGHTDRTYDYLLRAAHKIVERKRHDANRADMERQLRGDGAPAAPAKGKGKGKGDKKKKDKDGKQQRGRSASRGKKNICYDLKNKGKCDLGDNCTFSHDLSRNNSSGRGSSNGSNKGGGKSRGNTPDPKRPCQFFSPANARLEQSATITTIRSTNPALLPRLGRTSRSRRRRQRPSPRLQTLGRLSLSFVL
jgi:hypothetical protein